MNDRIKSLASRMKDLQLDPSDPQQATLYNFTIGAIYSLARAEQLGYPRQSQQPGRGGRRTEEVKTFITRMLVEDRPPEHGEWLAGFYFNDAIFRADVAFEHTLRYVANIGPTTPVGEIRREAARKRFPPELLTIWSKKARDGGSALKHRSLELLEDPGLSVPDAISVIENLVCAVEWIVGSPPSWKTHQSHS